jgi:hypothetical protein
MSETARLRADVKASLVTIERSAALLSTSLSGLSRQGLVAFAGRLSAVALSMTDMVESSGAAETKLEFASSDPFGCKTAAAKMGAVQQPSGVVIPVQSIFAWYGVRKGLAHHAVFTRLKLGAHVGKGLVALDPQLVDVSHLDKKARVAANGKWFVGKALAMQIADWCEARTVAAPAEMLSKRVILDGLWE